MSELKVHRNEVRSLTKVVVVTCKRKIETASVKTKTIRETAEVKIGTVDILHFARLPPTITQAEKENLLDRNLKPHVHMTPQVVEHTHEKALLTNLPGKWIGLRVRIERVMIEQIPAMQISQLRKKAKRSILQFVGQRSIERERQTLSCAIKSNQLSTNISSHQRSCKRTVVANEGSRQIERECKSRILFVLREDGFERGADREVRINMHPPPQIEEIVASMKSASRLILLVITLKTTIGVELNATHKGTEFRRTESAECRTTFGARENCHIVERGMTIVTIIDERRIAQSERQRSICHREEIHSESSGSRRRRKVENGKRIESRHLCKTGGRSQEQPRHQ